METEQAIAVLPETLIPPERIERQIYLIRGQKVMLDADLAELYQVPTKALNLAVRRNPSRFPADFMFQLTKEELEALRFQIETSKGDEGRGGRRYLPYVFTEHGIAMLSSVLRSERAVQMNILIVRAFIRLRDMLLTHKDLAARIEALEQNQQNHASVINILRARLKTSNTCRIPGSAISGSKRPTKPNIASNLHLAPKGQ